MPMIFVMKLTSSRASVIIFKCNVYLKYTVYLKTGG